MEAGAGSEATKGAGGRGLVARRELLDRLGGRARVTVVSAPAGSGKTVLLRSWIGEADRAGRAALVAAEREERDPERFWLSALNSLRRTTPGSGLVGTATAAPDQDGWAIVETLLEDLVPLTEPLWLVIDDVHELDEQALRQLELLIMRAPRELRFVLAARHDMRLGLHRLRLDGELAEVRSHDLRFSLAEAGELFAAAGVELPAEALAMVHAKTEGWVAGLRLAALALVGRHDPERFAAEFSGSERTVAEYLLAEVLDRQDEHVRRLLLRTSILGRVNGELADLLSGGSSGEQVLQDLEAAGAFVTSLDPSRSWFRYHQMFADLLRLELRRCAPGEVAGLHREASEWFAARGAGVEAVRHAQAAGEWGEATRLFVRHWPSMQLDGQGSVVHELLEGFPPELRATDAELAAVAAGDELARGLLEAAERYLALAEQRLTLAPDQGQRDQCHALLGVLRLVVARQRGNPQAVREESRRLQDTAEAARPGLTEGLRALALISLGVTEYWTASYEKSLEHLKAGVALARRGERPYLEFTGLAYHAAIDLASAPYAQAAERANQAFELAQVHGWADDPAAGVACTVLSAVLALQGRAGEAEAWAQRAERMLRAETEPASAALIYHNRGLLELERGQDADGITAFRTALQLGGRLSVSPFLLSGSHTQTLLLLALVRLGATEQAEQELASLDDAVRESDTIRIAEAGLRLAQANPRAATAALTPLLQSPDHDRDPGNFRMCLVLAFLLEAIARDTLGDPDAATNSLEHALDLAEPDGVLLPFMLFPAPALLERHLRRRTTHAALTAQILDMLVGNPVLPRHRRPQLPPEPLTESEIRVLRYLPTNLSVPEIARELYLSASTVKTHVRHLYAKLGSHSRSETLARARDLGLLAPVTRVVR